MTYFERATLNVIEAAGKAVVGKNLTDLGDALDYLKNRENGIDSELSDLLSTPGLGDDHPSIKRARMQKKIITQMITGFTLYYRFLSDGWTNYIEWANEYNDYYKQNPADVFQGMMATGEISASSEEYQMYRSLKAYINPAGSGSPDPQPTDTVTLYHVIDDITKVVQIKNTRKLIASQYSNILFFLGSMEDIKKYYSIYQIRVPDTSVNPPIMKPLSRVNVAKCVMTKRIVNNYPNQNPNEPPAFTVTDIYIPWIVVIDVEELLIEPNKIFSRRIGRARLGTG